MSAASRTQNGQRAMASMASVALVTVIGAAVIKCRSRAPLTRALTSHAHARTHQSRTRRRTLELMDEAGDVLLAAFEVIHETNSPTVVYMLCRAPRA